MIESLRKTVENEIDILRELAIFSRKIEGASPSDRKLLTEGMNSLAEKLRSTNNLISELVNSVETPAEKKIEKKTVVETSEKKKISAKSRILPDIGEREKVLEELSINEAFIKKIKKKKVEESPEKIEEFKKARGYLKLSNRFFLETSDNLIRKGYFTSLPAELKKANLDILFEAYVSMILFSVFLSFFAAIFAVIFFIFFDLSFVAPFISSFTGNLASRLLRIIWLPLIVPIMVFVVLYYYPTLEKKSISKRIEEELPFAVIHMSSISGSGIEPTEIFKIIALSREYPFLRKEIRKILNQINIYGYDLVTALNNVSKSTSNQTLSELLAGLATTINSGGSLSDFFQKRAETLLINYKLEKEKAIKVAETSMDIYISVVIAAPMILMLMLVMISVSGIQIGFTPYELTFLTIGGVALINVIFLGYLQTKRTLY